MSFFIIDRSWSYVIAPLHEWFTRYFELGKFNDTQKVVDSGSEIAVSLDPGVFDMREFWTDTLEHVTVFDLVLTARQVLLIISRDDRAFDGSRTSSGDEFSLNAAPWTHQKIAQDNSWINCTLNQPDARKPLLLMEHCRVYLRKTLYFTCYILY